MASKNRIYTVHAYRWGDRECHSYPVGIYTKKQAALNAADKEEEWRGGNKYICEVCEWMPGSTNEDGSPGMPYKTIKALPRINTLQARMREENGGREPPYEFDPYMKIIIERKATGEKAVFECFESDRIDND